MKQSLMCLVGLAVLLVLFQNQINFDIAFDPKYRISDETRRIHAKELLGKKFRKSAASEQVDEGLMSLQVYNIVHEGTPLKYKNKVEKMTKTILEEAIKYNIDPIFIASIIKTESGFNPTAKGTSGEVGLMQLMPATGEYIAKKIKLRKYKGAVTLKDPVKNIKIGAAYLNYLRKKFDNQAYKYVPAYNMGPGNVLKLIKKQERPKIYSTKVLKFYEKFYKQIYVSQMLKLPQVAQK